MATKKKAASPFKAHEQGEQVSFAPALPITEFYASIGELIDASVTINDGVRTINGTFLDGSSFELIIDGNDGTFSGEGKCLADVRIGDDQSHTVVSYRPFTNALKKHLQ